jgi:carboxypeptidase Taq
LRFFSEIWKPRTGDYDYTGWQLADEINALNPESVLDVGCGYHPFKGRIPNLIGIDPYNNCADFMVDILDYKVKPASHDHIIALGSINFNSQDVRVTTRINENDFANMLWSCIHEGGHALYEQGLPASEYGLPLGEYCSLSIHESQSRLWENCVGRSLPFWKGHYQNIQQHFPQQFGAVDVEDFYKAINKVQPSLIRTESDELTYHFHVMIRYEIEKELIGGIIGAKDIPARWNELYQQYLGVSVPDDKMGCLQDVHWSHGSFGYFATYSIGSLYAAQLYAAILAQKPSIKEEMSNGNTHSIWAWLQQHIYPFGRYYNSEELCLKATGTTLSSSHFIEYVTEKYKGVYGI